MNNQLGIIGLGEFAKNMIDELLEFDCDILLVDKNRDIIELYKDRVAQAYIADVINEETIQKLIPTTMDAVIVDLGNSIEASILVTNYLKKLGIKRIIAKAETEEHGEILELVGATQVVFPDQEAAKRITPLLVSNMITSYLPISDNFVIAEVKPPLQYIGKSLIQANLRQNFRLNVIAIRKTESEDYSFFTPDYIIQREDIFLLAGLEDDISNFAKIEAVSDKKKRTDILSRFLSQFKKPRPKKK